MSLPVAVYGLEVPAGEILVPADMRGPQGHIRITMAAIDPTASPIADSNGDIPPVPRSTLKLIRLPANFDGEDGEEDEDEDEDGLDALLNTSDDDESSDEENGGPSDPVKNKKAARKEALRKLVAAAQEEEDEEDEEMEDVKGKGVATGDESDEDDEEDEDEPEEFVICTLDTERNFQQPIDIQVCEGEQVFFLVKGTHNIYLTGNYVIDADAASDDEDSDHEEDCPSCDSDYEDEDDYSEDELDQLDMQRVTELSDSEDDEAPILVDTSNKGKKRSAETLDAQMDEAQTKKRKKEVASATKKDGKVEKDKKSVQFAKKLEQGPTGSTATSPAAKKNEPKKAETKAAAPAAKASQQPSKRVVSGVIIDDRKIGSGRAAKKGDVVSMRYIGKLDNGKVFDANKKGKPFSFKLGKGEVIKGWDIGVSGMAIGGERRLIIPAPLAYGSKALPGIPGNSQLTFDVKLLEIK